MFLQGSQESEALVHGMGGTAIWRLSAPNMGSHPHSASVRWVGPGKTWQAFVYEPYSSTKTREDPIMYQALCWTPGLLLWILHMSCLLSLKCGGLLPIMQVYCQEL